jgi:hypothetical protein
MSNNKTSLFVRAFTSDMDEQSRVDLIKDIFAQYTELVYDPKSQTSDIVLIKNPAEYGGEGFRNFCFVKVEPTLVDEIVSNLDGAQLENGVELVINVAKPREDKPRTFGAGGQSKFKKFGNSNGSSSNYSKGGYDSRSNGNSRY